MRIFDTLFFKSLFSLPSYLHFLLFLHFPRYDHHMPYILITGDFNSLAFVKGNSIDIDLMTELGGVMNARPWHMKVNNSPSFFNSDFNVSRVLDIMDELGWKVVAMSTVEGKAHGIVFHSNFY